VVIKKNPKPTASKLSVLGQLCELIPAHLVGKLARETGVHSMARSFSRWSHVVSMLFAQLTHTIGLNDVCDALRLHSGPLSALGGATVPSRNNLSHANKRRDAALDCRIVGPAVRDLSACGCLKTLPCGELQKKTQMIGKNAAEKQGDIRDSL
jgi:hypothetical protein